MYRKHCWAFSHFGAAFLVCTGACSHGPSYTESRYRNSQSAVEVKVRDIHGEVDFTYPGHDAVWLSGDGTAEPGVRCAYIARIGLCIMLQPRNDHSETTADGGIVTAYSVGFKWRFVYQSHEGDPLCGYTVWSRARGVEEFGQEVCSKSSAPIASWVLQDEIGFFR